jgi:hypothetical protein
LRGTRRLILVILALSTTPRLGLAGDVPCPTALTPAPVPLELLDEDLVPAPRALRLSAFDIAIVPGPGLAAQPAAMAAFERAARQWEAYISDPITVTIEAEIAPIGDAQVIGRTASVALSGDYDLVRNRIVADADADDGVLAWLPTAGELSTYLPPGYSLTGRLVGTKANFKAAGFGGLDEQFGPTDATIVFNSLFDFDFDNRDGVMPGAVDFETVAAHEIGHALGFQSEVDIVDMYLPPLEVDIGVLDLFRFRNDTFADPSTSAQFQVAPRSLVPAQDDIFDVVTLEARMSTGAMTGDGRQASHWKDDVLTGLLIGLMDPTLPRGSQEAITAADIRALDAIGWDIIGGVVTTTTTTSTTSTTTSTATPTSTTTSSTVMTTPTIPGQEASTTTVPVAPPTTTTQPTTCVDTAVGLSAVRCRLGLVADVLRTTPADRLGGRRSAKRLRRSLGRASVHLTTAELRGMTAGRLGEVRARITTSERRLVAIAEAQWVNRRNASCGADSTCLLRYCRDRTRGWRRLDGLLGPRFLRLRASRMCSLILNPRPSQAQLLTVVTWCVPAGRSSTRMSSTTSTGTASVSWALRSGVTCSASA